MTALEVAWLAGLLEGEGTFGLYGAKTNGRGDPQRRSATIALRMTDKDIVVRVARLFGRQWGVISPRIEGRKTQYRVEIRGQEALDTMREILPYMGERRGAKIKELIDEDRTRV